MDAEDLLLLLGLTVLSSGLIVAAIMLPLIFYYP